MLAEEQGFKGKSETCSSAEPMWETGKEDLGIWGREVAGSKVHRAGWLSEFAQEVAMSEDKQRARDDLHTTGSMLWPGHGVLAKEGLLVLGWEAGITRC